ncbi:hypothetical protein GGH99_007913, partial [Coemansia sp. RSA 1285]
VLVDTVDVVIQGVGIKEKYIGLTLFALVPNVTEFLNAIAFAIQNNIALSIEISNAYTVQVVLLQIPILVLFSAFYGVPDFAKHLGAGGLLTRLVASSPTDGHLPTDPRAYVFALLFPLWDLIAALFCVFLLTYMLIEGKANYFKGSILCLSYCVWLVSYAFEPASSPGFEMFGNTGNSGSGGGFGFNLGGGNTNSTSGSAAGGFGAPASSGASSSNMFSTPTTSNTNTTAFGAPGVASKPAASSFSFSTPTAASSGGGGSLFGSSAAASKPLTGFSFGTSTAQAPATGAGAGAAAGGGSSIFGGASKPPQTVPFGLNTSAPPAASTATLGFGGTSGASATAAPSGPLFGGTISAAAAAPSSSADSGFGFGGFGAKPAATTGGASLAPKAQTPFSLASPFGSSATTAAAAGTNASAAASTSTTAATGAANPTTGTGLGGFKLSTAPAVSEAGEKSSTTAATAGTASAAAGGSGSNTATATAKKDSATELANAALRGKTVEEIAQMWTSELAAQTRAFHTQANTVAYWDRALVQQGKRITGL